MRQQGRYRLPHGFGWVLVAILVSGPLRAQTAADRWWELRLGGQAVGYFQESTRTLEDHRTLTTERLSMTLNRLGKQVSLRTVVETTESAGGVVEVVTGETSSSAQSIKYEARIQGQSLLVRMETGGQAYERTLPIETILLGPKGVEKLSAAKLKRPGDEIFYYVFYGDFVKVLRSRRVVKEEESTANGKLLKVEEELEGLPGKQTTWLDAAGRNVRRIQPLPFGDLLIEPSDAGVVARTAAGGELPAESYERTMAVSNIRLPDPRSIERIKLRIKHRRPDLGWPTFESTFQRVLEKTADTVVLELWRPAPPPESVQAEVQRTGGFLEPNAFLQSDDPEVSRIAKENAAGSNSAFVIARKLHDWTSIHMTGDLGIAFAPASEVVRNRRGTCAAYSVLFASLLRAAGIPSRIGAGYIYAAGMWGGHWWTEVKVGNQWVPLDAAVYRPGPADPARIQFGSTTLADNGAEANADGLRMYSNVDVQVLEFTIAGRRIPVPEDAKPYSVAGDVYSNAWLGFTLRKPPGFAFAKLNAIYPDKTVLRLEGSDRQVVTVEYPGVSADFGKASTALLREVDGNAKPQGILLGGRKAQIVATAERARLVLQGGLSLWVLTAEGKNAESLLRTTASAWEWHPPQP